MKLTGWYRPDQKPVRVGWYECRLCPSTVHKPLLYERTVFILRRAMMKFNKIDAWTSVNDVNHRKCSYAHQWALESLQKRGENAD